MKSQFSVLLQKFERFFIGKGCATIGIDMQAPRFAPLSKGFRVEFSLNYCPASRFNLGRYIRKQVKVFPIGIGQQECVRKDGAGCDEIFFAFIPDHTNRYGKLFHKYFLHEVS